ncbi:MAG: bifunctional pyr operon transcriptional regulator/uracil phosphoribosyltransferase PyrR [Gemmatimonadetes bacterium]|nr:bifunctional pyr operon transcriptional regulator/uracil phosphoribosyltransferase PyrR [Gemmatimonadota bacterium]
MADPQRKTMMTAATVEQTLARMAGEIVEQAAGAESLVLVGIHRRGVHLATWLAGSIQGSHPDLGIATGTLDITLYRDDLMTVGPRPVVGPTRLPTGGIDGRLVVIVDDVLYTGRTVRAALDELADFGRPRRTLLCVLVDRGGRELPIQPDIVGEMIPAPPGGRVEVLVPEIDGNLGVVLVGGSAD